MSNLIQIVYLLSSLCILNIASLPTFLSLEEENATPNEWLLPGDISPTLYEIHLEPFINEVNDFKFYGNVKIHFEVKKSTKLIVLHSDGLNYTSINLINENTYIQKNISPSQNETLQFLYLNLKSEIKTGFHSQKYILELEYWGELADNMQGFYRSTFKNNLNRDVWIAATQFEPTFARKAFPCLDEPSYKANFIVSITHETDYDQVLSNMPIDTSEKTGKKITTTFQQTDKLPTYLVAFAVTSFVSKTNEDRTNFKVYSRNKETLEQTKLAVTYGPKLLSALEKWTGIPYTNKMYLIAIPDFYAGAMENWGLITFRESDLLYDPDESPLINKQSVISVIAHELSHQWFGDLVTLHWWSDTWLNEGFATYFQYHAAALVDDFKDWELDKQFVVDYVHTALAADQLMNVEPMTAEVYTTSQIQQHFNAISYNKGGSILRMIQHLIGADKFQKALQNYLKNHKNENSKPEDVFEVFDAESKDLRVSVKSIMESYTSQSGYPVVSVSSIGNGFVQFKQERFLLRKDENYKNNQYWFIPISYSTENEPFFNDTSLKLLLQNNNDIVERQIFFRPEEIEKGSWIILNMQQTGYYRIKYDDKLMEQIIRQMKDKHEIIHELNRAQIVDDTFILTQAGQVDYKHLFDLIKYLKKEDSMYPWVPTINGITYLMKRAQGNQELYDLLAKYFTPIVEAGYTKTGFYEKKEEKHVDTLKRSRIVNLACLLDIPDCVVNSTEVFNNYLNNSDNRVPSDVKQTVYCTAMRHGNETHFGVLWNLYQETDIASEKIIILKSLGCTKDESLLQKYLDMSIDPTSGIRPQDAQTVFQSVYSSGAVGVKKAFEFLQTNYTEIADNYGGMGALGSCITELGSRLTTKEDIDKFEKFVNDMRKQIEDVDVIADNAIETSKVSYSWNEANEGNLVSFLKNASSDDDNGGNDDNGGDDKPGAANSILITNSLIVFMVTIYLYLC